MAHQFIAQLDQDIKDAVFGNVGSIASFRIGSEDAQFLESQFAPVFSASDLMQVPNYNAMIKMLANGTPSKPFSFGTMPPFKADSTKVAHLKAVSANRYGRPRADVEDEIRARYVKEPLIMPPLSGMM